MKIKQLVQIQTDSDNQIIPLGIDLSDSFILNWVKGDSKFEIELELSIWSESPYYRKSIINEHTCYRKGILRFHEITEIHGFVELDSVKPNIDLDGSKDWECIYNFRKEKERLKFNTEFTELDIVCSKFEIELTD